jgi:hypothetical protein
MSAGIDHLRNADNGVRPFPVMLGYHCVRMPPCICSKLCSAVKAHCGLNCFLTPSIPPWGLRGHFLFEF